MGRYGLKSLMKKELKMYSPVLSESLIRTMYRLKRVWKQPMTEIAEGLIQKSLGALDKEMICRVCISEGNNDCESCCLADGKKASTEKSKKRGGEKRWI